MTTFRQLLGVLAMYRYFLVRALTGAFVNIGAILWKCRGNATDASSSRQRPLSGHVNQEKYKVPTLDKIQTTQFLAYYNSSNSDFTFL
jgi:hypothetical protein